MQNKQSLFQSAINITAIALLFFVQANSNAEVIRDGTIGPDASIQPSGPHFEIPESFGELNGTNLFHSFQEFSLNQDQSATFSGTSTIHNIISRVTGDNVSNIDGLLRSTVPGADLYLMNPNGIVFGANAQLDVRGAFHASTAGQLLFVGGEVFSAIPDTGKPILAVGIPERFGFLGSSAATIELYGSTLESTHDIALSGGTVALRDGASIVTATNNALDGANIILTAAESVVLSGTDSDGQGSGLDAGTSGNGKAGEILIKAPRIELKDGAWMSASTSALGNGGAVQLVAGERITLFGQDGTGEGEGISSKIEAQASSDGNAGSIRLEAPVIELGDGAQLTSTTAGTGNGGELLLTATERITLAGKDSKGLGTALQAGASAEGNGGTVSAIAPMIELRDGARVTTTTSGGGNAGDILITAAQRLTLSGINDEGFGSSLQANTTRKEGKAGKGGNILVTAPVVELQDGASMQTNTSSMGEGGKLLVTANERVTLSGTDGNGFGSYLQTTATGAGQGGTLEVTAPIIALHDGAFMEANTAGANLGGTLTVNADERLTLSGTNQHGGGSGLVARAQERGNSQSIKIEAGDITLADGAFIESTSVGTGDAGSISIEATGTLRLSDRSIISTAAGSASGGGINIKTDGVTHLVNSEISTNVGSGPKNGGNITIASDDALILNDSRITAKADFGDGGNININANQMLATPDSVIDASASAGGDGNVVIITPESDLASELVRPAIAFLDASATLQPGCEARALGSPGRFSVARQQGLPLSPENLLLAFDAPVAPVALPTEPVPLEVSALDTSIAPRVEALRGIAIEQQAAGQYSASLATLNTAMSEDAAQQKPQQFAATMGSAANAYLALGLGEIALAHFTQAIQATAPDAHVELAILHNNLGNLHMVRQDFTAASGAYAESVQHARRANDVTQVAKALSNGARAALAEGRLQHAADLQRNARTASLTVPGSQAKAYILIHLAKTAQQLSLADAENKRHHYATAYTDLRNAVTLSSNLGDDRTLSYALGNLGSLYQQQHRLEEALYLTRLAQRAAERANAPESHYRWHWQAGQLLWEKGEYPSALQAYRRAVAIVEGSRPETLAQYGAAHAHFRQVVAPVYLDFVDTLLQYSSQVEDPDALLREARATVEQFKAAELRDYFRDECITELEAKNTRLENVSPAAAIIYPIILPQRLELLVSLPSGLRRYPVAVDAASLARVILQFRTQVETRGADSQLLSLAQRLYDWLVRPYVGALSEAGIDTLVFVPDGPLRSAPLAALHDGDDYLVRRFGIVVTPGLSLTDPRPLNRENPKLLLAGLSDPVQDFSALPNVSQELQYIQQLFGGSVLLNEEFTRPRVEQALDTPVSIVHLASHARFTGNPDDSYLLTHNDRLSMKQLDELLQVTRFRDQPLELLVLSACQTAVGDERAAMGLASIGLKAGARSALGTLWPISDESTSELMSGFYHALKYKPALTKAHALQKTQQVMLTSERFNHPFYWSAFVLINNWL